MDEGFDYMEHYPQRLDLNDYNLGSLFCRAGCNIDHLLTKNPNFDFRPVARVGRIIYTFAESLKSGGLVGCVLLSKVLETHTGQRHKEIGEMVKPLKQMGLDYIKMKELSRKKQEELRDLSLILSKKSREYWFELNPNGFRSSFTA